MPRGQLLRAHKAWPEGVEEDLEGGKEGFSEHVLQAHQFNLCWKISVDAIFAEVLVVLDVVALKSGARESVQQRPELGLKNVSDLP